VSADVVLAGTETVAIGPADLNLAEGTSTIVYAGVRPRTTTSSSPSSGSGLHSAPGSVPSGTGGLVDDSLPLPLIALTAVAPAARCWRAGGSPSPAALNHRVPGPAPAGSGNSAVTRPDDPTR
jgi:hypothetical protein